VVELEGRDGAVARPRSGPGGLGAHLPKEGLAAIFADIAARPSFRQLSVPGPADLHERWQHIEHATVAAWERIRTVANEALQNTFIASVFGSSEGTEMRLLMLGFKPAVLSNMDDAYISKVGGPVVGYDPIEATPMAIARHGHFPNIHITRASYALRVRITQLRWHCHRRQLRRYPWFRLLVVSVLTEEIEDLFHHGHLVSW